VLDHRSIEEGWRLQKAERRNRHRSTNRNHITPTPDHPRSPTTASGTSSRVSSSPSARRWNPFCICSALTTWSWGWGWGRGGVDVGLGLGLGWGGEGLRLTDRIDRGVRLAATQPNTPPIIPAHPPPPPYRGAPPRTGCSAAQTPSPAPGPCGPAPASPGAAGWVGGGWLALVGVGWRWLVGIGWLVGPRVVGWRLVGRWLVVSPCRDTKRVGADCRVRAAAAPPPSHPTNRRPH